MPKKFIVEEAKLASFVDSALKAGGLALHGAAKVLLESLVEHTEPAPVAPAAPVAATPAQ